MYWSYASVGGLAVDNATLLRFFRLHFMLPFIAYLNLLSLLGWMAISIY